MVEIVKGVEIIYTTYMILLFQILHCEKTILSNNFYNKNRCMKLRFFKYQQLIEMYVQVHFVE